MADAYLHHFARNQDFEALRSGQCSALLWSPNGVQRVYPGADEAKRLDAIHDTHLDRRPSDF